MRLWAAVADRLEWDRIVAETYVLRTALHDLFTEGSTGFADLIEAADGTRKPPPSPAEVMNRAAELWPG